MFTLLHEAQMGSEPDPEVRSLGEALGRLQLEPVAPSPANSGSPSNIGGDSPSAATESSEEPAGEADTGEPFRFYAVWKVPDNRSSLDLVGIHTGRGIAAYRQIILANGGIFEGIRFRRAPSLRAAQELFLSEAAQHGVDPLRVNHIHQWA